MEDFPLPVREKNAAAPGLLPRQLALGRSPWTGDGRMAGWKGPMISGKLNNTNLPCGDGLSNPFLSHWRIIQKIWQIIFLGRQTQRISGPVVGTD